eukprot:tig00000405_g483.t1
MECAICLDPLSTSHIGVLPCKHAFCISPCLMDWSAISTSCPTCQAAFSGFVQVDMNTAECEHIVIVPRDYRRLISGGDDELVALDSSEDGRDVYYEAPDYGADEEEMSGRRGPVRRELALDARLKEEEARTCHLRMWCSCGCQADLDSLYEDWPATNDDRLLAAFPGLFSFSDHESAWKHSASRGLGLSWSHSEVTEGRAAGLL